MNSSCHGLSLTLNAYFVEGLERKSFRRDRLYWDCFVLVLFDISVCLLFTSYNFSIFV